jgi:hypothetical protein
MENPHLPEGYRQRLEESEAQRLLRQVREEDNTGDRAIERLRAALARDRHDRLARLMRRPWH